MKLSTWEDLGVVVRGGEEEQRGRCPKCGRGDRDKKTFGFNVVNGKFGCFRCHFTGRLGTDTRNVTPIAAPARQQKFTTLSDYGRKIWESCYPPHGIALDYLESRCCVIPPRDGDLRYHPSLKHPSGYVGPALVALVTHAVTGEPLTLHRTWITSTGKAAVKPPRLLLAGHNKLNGVIRLWPDDAVITGLGVAEGIETALCAAHGFQPVWSCIDSGNLTKLPLLNGISSLVIFADHDPAGISASNTSGQRWADAGRDVVIAMSERAGFDIADEVAA